MIRVGLALAYIQGIVVVAIAIVFAVVHHDGIVGNSAALIDTPEKSEIMESYALILRYTYFFLALGITLTHGRWTEIAVEDIRRSSLELDSFGTSQTIESIFGQFVIVTICFGIAVLRPPPGFIGALVNPLEACGSVRRYGQVP
jgi:hypothetical protein